MEKFINPYFELLDKKIASKQQSLKNQKINKNAPKIAFQPQSYGKVVDAKNILFIIGNGFDLYHGANTSYASYKAFLREKFPLLVRIFDDNLNWFKKEKVNQITKVLEDSIFNDFDNSWNNVEHVLGSPNIPIDRNLTEQYQISPGLWSYLFTFLVGFWIKNLVESEAFQNIRSKQNLHFPKKSFYLNFNYTPILETVYGVPHNVIKYIHGFYKDNRLLFGHSDQGSVKETRDDLQTFYKNSFKNVQGNIAKNSEYFEMLKSNHIEKIWVLGHSLNDVDYPYFEMVKNFFPSAYWIIAYYKNEDVEKIKKTKAYSEIRDDFKELRSWSNIAIASECGEQEKKNPSLEEADVVESDPILASLKEIQDSGDDLLEYFRLDVT